MNGFLYANSIWSVYGFMLMLHSAPCIWITKKMVKMMSNTIGGAIFLDRYTSFSYFSGYIAPENHLLWVFIF
jgi:hypothetical protein